jgi:hypothetical protein
MGQLVFNVARGRAVEFHRRVVDNDPANSALIVVVLAEAGLESDDVLRDYDTLADLLAGASNEVTNTGYARKVLTDAQLSAPSIDDALDRVALYHPTLTWTSVAAGDSWRKVVYCYDADTTSGTDANLVPICACDMLINGAALIPGGANIAWAVPNGYYISGP